MWGVFSLLKRTDILLFSPLFMIRIARYVTFENYESRRRCLEDYHPSGSWWRRCLQPRPLRFPSADPNHKHAPTPLHVRPAPDPSDVLYENLDATWCARMCRRSISWLITVLLLLVSFAIIWEGNYLQSQFQAQSPDLSLCGAIAEQYRLFGGGNTGSSSSNSLLATTVQQTNRSDATSYGIVHSEALDATCATSAPVTATAEVAAKRVWLSFGNASANATYLASILPGAEILVNSTNSTGGGGGGGGAINLTDCHSPCVDLNNKELQCPVTVISAFTGKASVVFFRRDVVVAGCFCKQELASRSSLGLLGSAVDLGETEGAVCGEFATSYASTLSILVGVALVVVIVNVILKAILKALARFEHHHSASALSVSLVLKAFFAQFLNTGLIILVVNANVPSLTVDIGIGKIFNGEFDEFDMRWYAVVGASVSLTMVLNIIIPHLGPVIQWLLVAPCKRRCSTPYSQQAMNKLYSRPEFNLTTRSVFKNLLILVSLVL